MPIEIRLPQFGMGMQEGTINRWYKQEGDTVDTGEVIAEMEAAKTTEDLRAPGCGVLHQVLVAEGVTVPVNELLALLVPVGEDRPVPVSATPAVTPRARRLAKELGVDLATVTGSGPGGRITEEDVAPARSLPETDHQGLSIPVRGIRATIAHRMLTSLQSTAQLTLVTTVDVTDLVAYRDQLEDPRPSYTDFIVKAAALALRQHPRLNSTMEGDQIRLWSEIHVGVATALDDGLVVPVVRHADRKSLREIAIDSADLVQRVRVGDFAITDVSGGTFTVTSLGGRGIDAFTPILNPPEAAILGVGRVSDQPARDGDGLIWRKAITLSLTIDHRIVDGAPGAAFLETVAELLQTSRGLDR